jgi:hypothetical protein
MIRFGFHIRTRTGQKVENISIVAATQSDAERRLRQMYLHCEIIECSTQTVPRHVDTFDIAGIIGMLSAAPATATPQGAKVFRLREKTGTR